MTAVSADFAGRVNQLMEEKGFASIYLNGLCGDIDPWKPTDARLEEFAQDAFAADSQPLPLQMEAGELPFTLWLTSVTEGEIRGAAAHAVEVSGGADKPAARVAPGRYDAALEERAAVAARMLHAVLWMLDPTHIIVDCVYARPRGDVFIQALSRHMQAMLEGENRVLPQLYPGASGLSSVVRGAVHILQGAWLDRILM